MEYLKALERKRKESFPALSEYAVDLNALDAQYRTLRLNLQNYNRRLQKIVGENRGSDLQVLEKFSDLAAEKYLQQVKADYSNLKPGLTLLENLISTIGDLIEIEQTKSDRQLNLTIGAVATGLATSQIAAAVILDQNDYPKNIPFWQTSAFGWSLSIGAIAAFFVWAVLRLFRR